MHVSGYEIEVNRKAVKHLRLMVYPTTGLIRVSAPLYVDEQYIRSFVESRLGWIEQKLKQPRAHPQAEELQYVSGEYIPLEGTQYLLKVSEDSPPIRIRLAEAEVIELSIPAGTSQALRKAIFKEWYRVRLEQRIIPLMRRWQAEMGVSENHWATKQMKTRWGTCNTKAKRIWINLELAKRSDRCLEYIIVHELAHLIERKHDKVFYAIMDKYLPDWKLRKQELNNHTLLS